MKISVLVTSVFVLIFCWLAGVEIGLAETNRAAQKRELPYRAIMLEAMEGLKQAGVKISYPQQLPQISTCSACLDQHEAFGAYVASSDQIIVPDHFDVATAEGHAALIHEYGHFLLTKAGVLDDKQETLCLQLGNGAMQKYFTVAMGQ